MKHEKLRLLRDTVRTLNSEFSVVKFKHKFTGVVVTPIPNFIGVYYINQQYIMCSNYCLFCDESFQDIKEYLKQMNIDIVVQHVSYVHGFLRRKDHGMIKVI